MLYFPRINKIWQLLKTYYWMSKYNVFKKVPSITDVSVLGGGGQRFCDDCTKALVIKKPDGGGGA